MLYYTYDRKITLQVSNKNLKIIGTRIFYRKLLNQKSSRNSPLVIRKDKRDRIFIGGCKRDLGNAMRCNGAWCKASFLL